MPMLSNLPTLAPRGTSMLALAEVLACLGQGAQLGIAARRPNPSQAHLFPLLPHPQLLEPPPLAVAELALAHTTF
jgi:hypothetical protein